MELRFTCFAKLHQWTKVNQNCHKERDFRDSDRPNNTDFTCVHSKCWMDRKSIDWFSKSCEKCFFLFIFQSLYRRTLFSFGIFIVNGKSANSNWWLWLQISNTLKPIWSCEQTLCVELARCIVYLCKKICVNKQQIRIVACSTEYFSIGWAWFAQRVRLKRFRALGLVDILRTSLKI